MPAVPPPPPSTAPGPRTPDPRTVYPQCFRSYRHYQRWLWLLRASGEEYKPDKICIDCDSETQSEMLMRGRCRYPDTVFATITDEDGEEITVGVRP